MKNCNSIVKTVDAFIMHLNVQKIYQILLINIIIIFEECKFLSKLHKNLQSNQFF